MTSSVQQAQEMVSPAQKHGVVNIVNFTWGWLPLYVYLKELLDADNNSIIIYQYKIQKNYHSLLLTFNNMNVD